MVQKKRTIQIIAIAVVVMLFSVGTYAYITLNVEKQTTAPVKTKEIKVDDRISPLVTQGLVLEINRVRSRGIIDVMFKPGTSWRTPPTFYFITNIDGIEYNSKNVVAAGGAKTQTLFKTWDSIFMDNKVLENVTQGQHTSSITLTIMERDYKGLLGKRYDDVPKEKITLQYDYKTGHWTGDDCLNDTDGYGHFIGKNYELWFNVYQTCYNYDEIPYWTKVNVYNLNGSVDYSNYDPNQDGIPITWDFKWGYDPFAYDNHSTEDPDCDGLTNLVEYKLQKYYADPFHQDIYIEADGMARNGIFDPPHVLWTETQQFVIERFAEHNICLYIDNGWPGDSTIGGGEILPHLKTISQESGMMLQYYKWHFSDDRKGVFHYLLVGHNSGFSHPSVDNRYDTIAIDSSPYKLYLKRLAFTPRMQRLMLASTTMHELGHGLGIAFDTFEGCDNLTFGEGKTQKKAFLETWGNYKSVLNYYYIFDKKLVDYSDGSNGPYDQNDWEHFDLTYFQKVDARIEPSIPVNPK